VHDLVVDSGKDGGSRVRCEVDSDRLEDLLRLLVTAGVKTLTSQPPTLEELFLRHYESEPGEGAGRAGAATAVAKGSDSR
jgi:ABC-2 type transport system ATP-binding protein